MDNKLKLNTKDESLREVFSNGKKYFVPKFQRDYSWENEHWEMFWEDIEFILNQEEDYHYMGYLVLQNAETERNTFKIIDGQQRLTTFSLLVLAAIKRLKAAEKDEQERMDELHKNFIGSKDLVSLKMSNKIKLNRNNDYYFNEAIIGQDLPQRGKKKTVLLMGKSLSYFYNKLRNKTGEDMGRLIEIVSAKLLFTSIYIGSDLNAYKIFETLNARGTQLTSGDLLKNYLFSLIDDRNDTPDDVLDRLDEKWGKIGEEIGDNHYTDYILCDWNSTHKFVRKQVLFREIRKDLSKPPEADEYLNKLARNSQLYAALLNYEDEFWKDYDDYQEIKKSLYFLKLFHIRQPISLLFIACINYRQGFAKILKWITTFSLRYNVICREHAGEQEQLYNKICLFLAKKPHQAEALAEIKQLIKTLCPNDDRFKQAFIDKTMLTEQSNKKVRYLLTRLAEQSSHTSIDETRLTIEHILPDKPNDQWCDYFGDNWQLFTQRIGNMALVTQQENRELAQKPFENKKNILQDSQYSINHNVAEYDEWNSQNIESRQTSLAEIAIQLWKLE